MSKPTGPAKPARSLEESQMMLREATRHEQNRASTRAFIKALPAYAIVAVFFLALFGILFFGLFLSGPSPLAQWLGPGTVMVLAVIGIALLFRG